jgi:uncharacterized protein (DUF111 family)
MTLAGSWGDPPAMRLAQVGTGAGTREFPAHPNILRLLIGERVSSGTSGRTVAVLETAVDDENPQFMAALLPRLLGLGALDAMLAPVTMKKGRSGLWLTVICEPADARRLAETILAETSTLGVRMREEHRIELPRHTLEVQTEYGPVLVKVARLPDGGERAHPEYESVVEVAARASVAPRLVAAAAVQSFKGSVTTT